MNRSLLLWIIRHKIHYGTAIYFTNPTCGQVVQNLLSRTIKPEKTVTMQPYTSVQPYSYNAILQTIIFSFAQLLSIVTVFLVA